MTTADNIEAIRQRIETAATRSNRDPASVRLIGVTKGVDLTRVHEAIDAGLLDLGENFVQEAETRIVALDASAASARWHFIGHLQSNKVAAALNLFDIIQSVDSLRLAEQISRRADAKIRVLLEVNVAQEASKFGFAPAEVSAAVARVNTLENLELAGLMTIAPAGLDAETVRPVFRSLRDLAAANRLEELSMGMTDDFEVAIEEGATMVRIGRAIFGGEAILNLGIIGGGAMGEAIIASVIRNQIAEPTAIRVYDVATLRLHYLRQTYAVETAADAAEAVRTADLVLLAVKPQEFEKAAHSIGSIGAATAVSIMAGVPVAKIGKLLGTASVVRAMPNTPAQIGAGMTVWTATPEVSETARAGAKSVFAALGKEAFVPDEKYLDMATALSGSGPAYVFLFIEALINAGVHIGLSRDLAATMALQTVLGSARYAEETGKHPGELRNQVTSPGGTTAAALRALEAGGFRADILEAVIAAYERSRALGEGETK